MLVVIDSFLDGAFVFTVVRFSTEIYCVVAWNSKFHYFWVLTISKILAHFVEED